MSSLARLVLLLGSLTQIAPALQAQTAPAWNRRISDVHIVHPPGTPPGTWRVMGSLIIGDELAPPGSDLGCELTLSINGAPVQLVAIPVSPVNNVNGCNDCDLSPCVLMTTPWGTIGGACQQTFSFGCGCGAKITLEDPNVGMNLQTFHTGDILDVAVTPGPGSLPEIDTSDDTFSLVVGDHHPGISYCSGDGTLATACPCGNSGAPGRGCANSVDPNGALLAATGFTEVDPQTGTDAVVLHGSGMPATATAIYLKGDSSNASGAVFGDGVRCVAGSLIRMATKVCVGGSSSFPEAGDPSVSVKGGTPPGSGVTGWYQVYYRNPPDFCTEATFNISNGVQLVW